jgi:uncharacterized protein YbjQ (UPF0145 family)
MFFGKTKNEVALRWQKHEEALTDTKHGVDYPMNELFGCYDYSEKRCCFWFENKYLTALKMSDGSFRQLLRAGMTKCDDYIPPLLTATITTANHKVVIFEDAFMVTDDAIYPVSEIKYSITTNDNIEVSHGGEVRITIFANCAEDFDKSVKLELLKQSATLTGEALKVYNKQLTVEKDARIEAERAEERMCMEADGYSHIQLTTESVSPFEVEARLGIITAEYAHRTKLLKGLFAEVTSLGQERNTSTQNALKQARIATLLELRREAYELGADAVIAIDLDYSEVSGAGDPMLFLVASGTAIKIKQVG